MSEIKMSLTEAIEKIQSANIKDTISAYVALRVEELENSLKVTSHPEAKERLWGGLMELQRIKQYYCH